MGGGVPGDVAVSEDQDVRVREAGGAACLAALGGTRLMDDREPQAVQIGVGDLGQSSAEPRTVVVAVHGDESAAAALQQVEDGGVDPVPGVEHQVGTREFGE